MLADVDKLFIHIFGCICYKVLLLKASSQLSIKLHYLFNKRRSFLAEPLKLVHDQ